MARLGRVAQSRTVTTNINQHVGLIAKQVRKSLADAETRQLAVKIVSNKVTWRSAKPGGSKIPMVQAWGEWFPVPEDSLKPCPPRTDTCEIELIWNFVVENCRYVFDTTDVDVFANAEQTLKAGGGDCFPTGTQLLCSDGVFRAIDDVRPGMRIWGKNRWSEVTRKWFKGDLPVTVVTLNNGDKLRLTEDHKVYVIRNGEELRIPVSELVEGEELLQPNSISLPEGFVVETDPRMAELIGLYLAGGWCEDSRIGISGKDDHPNEQQKRCAKLAEDLGLNTGWNERYLLVYGVDIATRFSEFGLHAPDKHLPNLCFPKSCIDALTQGILADSGKTNTGTVQFTSTSHELTRQLRVLLRMQGISCGHAFIENHGGLGKHPIHRLYLRQSERGKNKKLIVKSIDRELFIAPCFDISTDDHYVYLPDADCTVSNCDDATTLFAALLKSVGFYVRARVISTPENPDEWVHIYPLVGVPKADPKIWIPLDCTVTGALPGWEYEHIAKTRDYDM